ncbi:MAG TPA: VOC family protein [Pseudonocardiaceae bacterium]
MASSQGTVIWFEIWVRDAERAKAFYGALFGWSFAPFDGYDPDNYWLIDAGEDAAVNGAVVREPDSAARPSRGTVIYVHVPELDRAVAKVVELGGRVTVPARRITEAGGSFAMVTDFEGNEVGLWMP